MPDPTPQVPYARTVTMLEDFRTVLSRLRKALTAQGFRTYTEFAVSDELRPQLGEEFEDYLVLGIGVPEITAQVLRTDRNVGVLLPLHLVIRSTVDGTLVQVIDPGTLMLLSRMEALTPTLAESTRRVERVLHALSTGREDPVG
ncbi:MAG TPA: ABC transporter ATP-binding protein [Streptomyces sp.]|nr:ABC transporter ATP-binding protein [Streptomyces sp.]